MHSNFSRYGTAFCEADFLRIFHRIDFQNFDDRVVIPEIEKCKSNHSAVFQAILYAIKGILMVGRR